MSAFTASYSRINPCGPVSLLESKSGFEIVTELSDTGKLRFYEYNV